MRETRKKVIVWTKGIDEFLCERGTVGGITVQMYFWSQIFVENGWHVYSFSERKKSTIEKIRFFKFPTIRFVGIFIELLCSLFYIILINPRIIIIRGAGRELSYLRIYSRMFNVKLVLFGASDSDFEPGKELIKAEHDRKFFRFGLRGVQYVVAQNPRQKKLLESNYGIINCIVIPNIWRSTQRLESGSVSNDILWVGNVRSLKRPEWFLELAKRCSEESFVMVGGASDKILYEKCESRAHEMSNISFLGRLPFKQVNSFFSSSKVFICTSEIEGFPNTFLQAWAHDKPVITSFDPGGIVEQEGLGIVVQKPEELENALESINNEVLYRQMQKNIRRYFNKTHNAQKNLNILLKYLDI